MQNFRTNLLMNFRTDSSLSKKVSKNIPTLSQKVSRGILWVILGTGSVRVLNIVSAIIVTNLLPAKAFGLIALITSIVGFSTGITPTGFKSALIQKQDDPEAYLDAAWTFDLIKFLILFGFLFVAAPILAMLFDEPRVTPILRLTSLSLVLIGFQNIGVVYFRKNLEIGKNVIFYTIPVVFRILTLIPCAFLLRNVWALVWAYLAQSLALFFLSYMMHPYRPRFDFNLQKAKTLFNFGKWILGTSLLSIARKDGIVFFIGKLFGATSLGFYNRAEVFSKNISEQVMNIIWSIGFPAYSQLQNERDRLKKVYLKTVQLLTFLTLPILGGVFVVADYFVAAVLTGNWYSIVPLMRILCLEMAVATIVSPSGVVFQAVGKPAIGTKILLGRVLLMALIIYPFSIQWGIKGVVMTLFLSGLVIMPFTIYQTIKILKYSILDLFKVVVFSILNTLAMVIVIFGIKRWVFFEAELSAFMIIIVYGVIFYFGISIITDRYFKLGIINIIRDRISALR